MKQLKAAARIAAFTLGGLVVVVAALYLLRHPILRGLGDLLTHVDPLEPSDLIVVLSGAADTRPFYAAELYAAGLASQIVVPMEEPTPTARLGLTRTGTEIAVDVLRRKGVPDSAIALISANEPVTSTREEALALREFVLANGVRQVTVVTSPFHTARARFTLRRALAGTPVQVRMAAAPEWQYDPERWWEHETGIASYGMEVLKWLNTLRVLE